MKRTLTFLLTALVALVVLAVNPSGSLPVMYIDTQNSVPVTSKDYYVQALCWLDPMGADVPAVGSRENPVALQIKGRGNYTWNAFDKKPYRLKFVEKVKMFDLNSSKHYALLAHADDNRGFLRDPMGFYISKLLNMPWTPEVRPVEVVLNGDYIGLYFLTENIRVDKKRVAITEQADMATDPEEITGGWLVEIDNYNLDPHVAVPEFDNHTLIFTYHSPELLSSQQENFLRNEMTEINSMLLSDDKANCAWASKVDLDQLARFLIVQELTDNYESFHGSCYLYRERGSDQKWKFGPVWDFGSAFNYDKTQYCWQGREHYQYWIGRMWEFPEFRETVYGIWEDFVREHYLDVIEYATNYKDGIREAAASDVKRWPQYGNRDMDRATDIVVGRLKSAFNWLCEQWGGEVPRPRPDDPGAITVYFADDEVEPWGTVCAYCWDRYGKLNSSWPGDRMWPVSTDDGELLMYTFLSPREISESSRIIFNNTGHGTGNQTADFNLVQNGYYDRDALRGTVGVEAPAMPKLKISAVRGGINVESIEAMTLPVVTVDGSQRLLQIPAGRSQHSLPAGFYIINRQKFIIR